jgi:flagellar basal-body rod protein FlgC
MWEALDIAGSATNVDQAWIDSIGANVANMNDGVTPGQPVYQAQYPVVQAQGEPGGAVSDGGGTSGEEGVRVASTQLGPAQGQEEYQPTNPLANAQGMMTYPVVDLATQMTDLIESQTAYQANAAIMTHANSAYQAILEIKA